MGVIDIRISALCVAPPELHPSDPNAFTNPAILVEVTSSSTAVFDRNGKRDIYLSCESLVAYLVGSQDSRYVELYLPGSDAPEVFHAGDSIPIEFGTCQRALFHIDAFYDGII